MSIDEDEKSRGLSISGMDDKVSVNYKKIIQLAQSLHINILARQIKVPLDLLAICAR